MMLKTRAINFKEYRQKTIFIGFLVLGGLGISFSTKAQSSDIYDTLLQRVHKEQLAEVGNINSLDLRVQKELKNLDTVSGRWVDVDYKDHKRIRPDWAPILDRIKRMTLAYTHPESKYYEAEKLWVLINRSLGYFSNVHPLPYCDNWYMQGIKRPRSLAFSLINMHFGKERLDSAVWQSTVEAMCKDTAVNSPGRNNPMHHYNYGANKADIANNWIYMAAILQNRYMLEVGVREVFAPISLTTGEGIQHDFSYDMHYGYLYNGGYGNVFMNNVIQAASYLKNTSYALKAEPLTLFRKFIFTSIFGVMRGSYMDWNVLGRGISRKNSMKKNNRKQLQVLQQIDPQFKKEYKTEGLRQSGEKPVSYGVKPAHAVFWTTDYSVHVRPSYFFSIHAVSSRNHAQEIGNKENLKGYWGAQGTTDLMVSGKEYHNIFPLWNWTKLPGTTLPDTLPIPKDKAPGDGDRYGSSSFSGGVSDSLYGVSAYVIEEDLKTSAKKAWFMFDKEIVCLGAGISSTLPYQVNTTLNQCLYDEQGVFMGVGDQKYYLSKDTVISKINQIDWVLHDKVAYLFPKGGKVDLSVEERKGGWSAIRGGQQNYDTIEKRIFQLTLNHGKKPDKQKYAYILVPNIQKPEEVSRYRSEKEIVIEKNNEEIQAVRHKELGIRQMVFYKKERKYQDREMSLWTDIPAVIMIEEIPGTEEYKLSVSDPTQLFKEIQIHLKLSRWNKAKTLKIALPQKPFAGSSVSVHIEG